VPLPCAGDGCLRPGCAALIPGEQGGGQGGGVHFEAQGEARKNHSGKVWRLIPLRNEGENLSTRLLTSALSLAGPSLTKPHHENDSIAESHAAYLANTGSCVTA
jgi:hypothetical protein